MKLNKDNKLTKYPFKLWDKDDKLKTTAAIAAAVASIGLTALSSIGFTNCLKNIDCPTLLFWGDKDDATPISDAKIMEKKIPDAGLVVLEGGSHFSFLENTPFFLRVADSFFEN